MTKKLAIALVATSLLMVGACTKTSDERGAPVNQPGETADQNMTPPVNQPDQPQPDQQPGEIQQPGASPSPSY